MDVTERFSQCPSYPVSYDGSVGGLMCSTEVEGNMKTWAKGKDFPPEMDKHFHLTFSPSNYDMMQLQIKCIVHKW